MLWARVFNYFKVYSSHTIKKNEKRLLMKAKSKRDGKKGRADKRKIDGI